jgi:hypothetical protein
MPLAPLFSARDRNLVKPGFLTVELAQSYDHSFRERRSSDYLELVEFDR